MMSYWVVSIVLGGCQGDAMQLLGCCELLPRSMQLIRYCECCYAVLGCKVQVLGCSRWLIKSYWVDAIVF